MARFVKNRDESGWRKTLTRILCTFDTLTKCRTENDVAAQLAIILINLKIDGISGQCDSEMKLLIGCNQEDIQVIRDFHKDMQTLYVPNLVVEDDLSN